MDDRPRQQCSSLLSFSSGAVEEDSGGRVTPSTVQLSSDMAGNNHCKLLQQMYISQSTYHGIIRCLQKVEIDFVCFE